MAGWLRVGYVQGNFNSDNCLLAGRTMDYGPFGFLERFDPTWNMWVGGGKKYSFIHQPKAAHRNFASFANACVPVLDQEGVNEAQRLVTEFPAACEKVINSMWQEKLGLVSWDLEAGQLLSDLFVLMAKGCGTDYTIFFRQLPNCLEQPGGVKLLRPAFYGRVEDGWGAWLQRWESRVRKEGRPISMVVQSMRKTSPKYVPREWMLVEAYEAACAGDHSVVRELHELFRNPYDEQLELAEKYYKRAPPGAAEKGGTAFMS